MDNKQIVGKAAAMEIWVDLLLNNDCRRRIILFTIKLDAVSRRDAARRKDMLEHVEEMRLSVEFLGK